MPTPNIPALVGALQPVIASLADGWQQHLADGKLHRADVWWILQALGQLGYAAEVVDYSLSGADRLALVQAAVAELVKLGGAPSWLSSSLVQWAMWAIAGVVKMIGKIL